MVLIKKSVSEYEYMIQIRIRPGLILLIFWASELDKSDIFGFDARYQVRASPSKKVVSTPPLGQQQPLGDVQTNTEKRGRVQ